MAKTLAYDSAQPWVDDGNRNDPLHRIKALVGHGAALATVYLVGSPGGFRPANRNDVAQCRAHGLGVLPNWERAADFFRTATESQCVTAGKEALIATRALGIPDDGSVAVAFSWDYQVLTGEFGNALRQLAACQRGLGSAYIAIGYAQADLLAYWAQHGHPGPHWLMASTWRATSQFTEAEVNAAHVAMVQSHDAEGNWLDTKVGGTDVNTMIHPETLAAWWPDDSPYGGDTLSAAEVEQIQKIVQNNAQAVQSNLLTAIRNLSTRLNAGQKTINQNVTAQAANIAAAVKGELPAGKTDGTYTVADIETATESAIRKVFADAGDGSDS